MLNGKNILITGGTGSFGKKFVEIVLETYRPEKLIIFSRDELKQFEMSKIWSMNEYPCIRYFLGDVRDKERLTQALNGVDFVIHSAALKQVPAAEYNPSEFVKTNVLGAMNVIDAAIYNNVKKVIALSTDKACNPINLYGATKLCSDKLLTAANVYSGLKKETAFSVVRYGNVLGSRGSVVPLLYECKLKNVLPITDPRMTRFWITLKQAVYFVLKALELAKGAEIFVPKIPTMKITDLAKAIAPGCTHEIIGARPGEKIHETLIGEDEGRNTTEYKECFIIRQNTLANKGAETIHQNGKPCEEGFRYISNTNPYRLTPEQVMEQLADDNSISNNNKTYWVMDDVPR